MEPANTSLKEKYLRVSELRSDGMLPKTACAQYPGQYCAFRAVAGIVPLIKHSYALLLGPAICLYNAKLSLSIRSLTSDPRPNNLLFLNYSQDEIIFGFQEKIKETIQAVDRQYHPEVLFVVTTCLQEIIGEDFDATIEEIQSEVKARLLAIHTENFTCEGAAPGIENIFLSLFKLMQPREIEKRSINILGMWTTTARNTELAHLLGGKGIVIKNVIPSYCTSSELSRAPGVQLNIVLDQYALPLVKKMKERFGTDYIYSRKPYLPDSIEKWYREIAAALNINLDREIKELKKNSDKLIDQKRGLFSGKTCAVAWNPGRPFDLAMLSLSLGFRPEAIILQNLLPEDLEDAKDLLAMGFDPIVFRGDNVLQTEELMQTLNPDFYIGSFDHQGLAKLGIESRSLTPSYFMLGFESTNEVLRLLSRRPAGFEALMYKERLLANGAV